MGKSWTPTPPQKQLMLEMGFSDVAYDGEDKSRVKSFLQKAGLSDNLDGLTYDNVNDAIDTFNQIKKYADDNDIVYSIDKKNPKGNQSWLTRKEDFDNILADMDAKGMKPQTPLDPKADPESNAAKTHYGDDYKHATGMDFNQTGMQIIENKKGKKVYDIPYDKNIGIKDKNGSQVYNLGLANLDRNIAEKYENKFIDEIYGTIGAEVGTEGQNKKFQGGKLAQWQAEKEGVWGGTKGLGKAMFGTDLIRVETELEIDTAEHYEHMTRGQIDWAAYNDDPVFNKAYKELYGSDASKLGVFGAKLSPAQLKKSTADQIYKIRKTNDLIETGFDKNWNDWTNEDWRFGEENKYTVDDEGNLFKDGLKEISWTDLMEEGGEYYVEPGTSKELPVGTDPDTGEPIVKIFTSPIEEDLTKLIYDPDAKDEKGKPIYDQTKDHVTPSGQTIEGKANKTELTGTPNIPGIKWVGGKPHLTDKYKVKLNPRPVIKPISNVSYAQNTFKSIHEKEQLDPATGKISKTGPGTSGPAKTSKS